MEPARPTEPIRHRKAILATSVVGLSGSWAVALLDPAPSWELRLTTAINDVPDTVASVLYPVMQLGTVAAPLAAAAGIVAFRKDRVLALATVAVGTTAWFGAKAVKELVGRDRPLAYVADLVVREGDGTGLGFISGHSAVAAATAVMVVAALPARHRWMPGVVAAVVGVARIVHGVHLPADVVGGWSFGALLGLGAVALAERLRPTPSPASDVLGPT